MSESQSRQTWPVRSLADEKGVEERAKRELAEIASKKEIDATVTRSGASLSREVTHALAAHSQGQHWYPGLIATPFSLLRCARAAMENVAATQSAFQRVRVALSS